MSRNIKPAALWALRRSGSRHFLSTFSTTVKRRREFYKGRQTGTDYQKRTPNSNRFVTKVPNSVFLTWVEALITIHRTFRTWLSSAESQWLTIQNEFFHQLLLPVSLSEEEKLGEFHLGRQEIDWFSCILFDRYFTSHRLRLSYTSNCYYKCQLAFQLPLKQTFWAPDGFQL